MAGNEPLSEDGRRESGSEALAVDLAAGPQSVSSENSETQSESRSHETIDDSHAKYEASAGSETADAGDEQTSLETDGQWETEETDSSGSRPLLKKGKKSRRRGGLHENRTSRRASRLKQAEQELERTKSALRSFDRRYLQATIEQELRNVLEAQQEEEARRERLREAVLKEIQDEEIQEELDQQKDAHIEQESETTVAYQPLTNEEFQQRVQERFGYSAEHLRALLEGWKNDMEGMEDVEDPDQNTKEAPKATWIKVHSKHLLPETLNEYKLPWAWDDFNPDYLLIKQWIDEDLQEELFEHTREILEAANTSFKRNRTDTQFTQFTGRNLSNTMTGVTLNTDSDPGDSDEEGFQDYVAPTCEETGEPLSFGVKMRIPAKQNQTQSTQGRSHRHVPEAKCLEFSSSRISGDGKVDLYMQDSSVGDRKAQMSWIHLERDARSFDEFIIFASQAPGLLEKDTAMIMKLLDKVRRGLRPAQKIDYLEHFVVRCEAQDPSGLQTAVDENAATFMSFPFFSVETAKASSGSHSRGLLQTYYHLEGTKQLDLEQTVQKAGRFPENHIIFVPQMWAVVLSSRFLITCAPVTLDEAAARSLRIMDPPKPRSSSGPSMIHLTDHCQRVFYIPIDHCRSWNALMDKVTNYCVDDIDSKRVECQIFTADDRQVQQENWQTILSNHATTILPLNVRLAALERPTFESHRDKESDTGLSDSTSIEDEPKVLGSKGESMALVKRVPTWVREMEAQEQRKATGDNAPPDGTIKRLLPVSSGIISNVTGARSPVDAESIYFEPDFEPPEHRPSSPAFTMEPDTTLKNPLSRLDTVYETSMEDSSPQKDGPVNLNVPPVFTWATGKRPTDGTTPSPLENDAVHAEEHSLAHVCEHLHSKLTHEPSCADVYMTISPQEWVHLDLAVDSLLGASISTLISTELEKTDTPSWKDSLKKVMQSLFRLLDFFIPSVYKCDVVDRYIGAVAEILVGINNICGESATYDGDDTVREVFEVVEVSGSNETDLGGPSDLDLLLFASTFCYDCQRRKQYTTRQAAIDHLNREHPKPNLTPEDSTYCVMRHQQRLNLVGRRTGEKILRNLGDHCLALERVVLEIRQGVSGNGKFDREVYRIPLSSVTAFQHLLTTVAYAAQSTRNALEQKQEKDNTLYRTPSTFSDFLDGQQLTLFGARAERALGKAREEIFLMTFTHDSWDIGKYQAGSPEFILLTLMDDLRSRDSSNKKVDLIQVYQQYMLRLETKVTQNPQHRTLRELRFITQELEIIRKLTNKQRLLCANYQSLLDPSSFRVTTAARKAAFETIEFDALNKLIRTLEQDADDIELLLEEAASLSRRTQSGIEVRQEDHGKAILVFTTITVIFLPLSFVTSYMGMNTVDIRDMGNNQSVFWAVSLPLTVAVVTLSLYIGFKGDDIQDFFVRSRSRPWSWSWDPLSSASIVGKFLMATKEPSSRFQKYNNTGLSSSRFHGSNEPFMHRLSRKFRERNPGMLPR